MFTASPSVPVVRTGPATAENGRMFRFPQKSVCRDKRLKRKTRRKRVFLSGTPEGTRTPGLTVRSRALYPAELQALSAFV